MGQARPRFWVALGEAQSKCEHLAGVPLRPDTADELHAVYLAKGINATTAIEGNTLTEREVKDRIEGKRNLPPSKEYMGKEVDNILKASNQILEDTQKNRATALSVKMIKDFNKAILRGLELPEYVIPGKFRDYSVTVIRYKGAPFQDCEYLMTRLCQWLNGPEFKTRTGEEIINGVLRSIIARLYIAWIHPFGDGNGRTARLVEVKILLESGVPSAAAHLLSNHYNATRTEYYRHLELASDNGGDILPFIQYAVQGFVDQLREQIRHIRRQQWDVTWVNFVHDRFRDKSSRADTRRKHLALAISNHESVQFSEIRRLTPMIAEAYAGKTKKTITRDLHALEGLDLIEKNANSYRAKKEKILAFLPVRHSTDT